MKHLMMILCALLLLSVAAQAEDKGNRRRQEIADQAELTKAEQQLKFYMDQLEKVKVKRWQDKRNAIARKEAFSEAWEDIRREMDQLAQRKSQQEGSLMRLDNQVQQMETEIKAKEDRQKEFGIQISEKAAELVKTIQGSFPDKNERAIASLRRIQSDMEARGFHPSADGIQNLFQQQKLRFALGESREIVRDQFTLERITPANPAENMKRDVPKTPGIVAGYFVRLGTVYKAFISTETPDAAILARSGNLGEHPWIWLENISVETKKSLQNSKNLILNQDSLQAPLILPVDVILRKATGTGYAAEEQKSMLDHLKEEWHGAGFVIYFLLIIATVALLIVGEKIFIILFRTLGSKRAYRKIIRLLDQGKLEDARQYASRRHSSTGKVLHAILEQAEGPRHEAEEAAYATMLHLQPPMERNINTINILAAAAPLVGLLGTVSGMINLFSAITMHGTNDPKIMAAGIAEALLATKWALITALPLMLIFNITSNLMGKAVGDMEKYAASLLNKIYVGKGHA
ncbi:MAG TPA: MotA/TolQ/ExbB proton channel family protein [Fibrobacteraceae bacterium]|nr:MotA/TolQ/ExbB proton channel family protein [Fibrobacteraceae bacterium]